MGNVVLPERAEWLLDYKAEFSKFTREMSHKHDDQIDPTLDAIADMLGGGLIFTQVPSSSHRAGLQRTSLTRD